MCTGDGRCLGKLTLNLKVWFWNLSMSLLQRSNITWNARHSLLSMSIFMIASLYGMKSAISFSVIVDALISPPFWKSMNVLPTLPCKMLNRTSWRELLDTGFANSVPSVLRHAYSMPSLSSVAAAVYMSQPMTEINAKSWFFSMLPITFWFSFLCSYIHESTRHATEGKNEWFKSDLCDWEAFPRRPRPNTRHSYDTSMWHNQYASVDTVVAMYGVWPGSPRKRFSIFLNFQLGQPAPCMDAADFYA